MITVTGRKLYVSSNNELNIGFCGDNKVEIRTFVITDSMLFDFNFKLKLLDEAGNTDIIDMDNVIENDTLYLTWTIEEKNMKVAGNVTAQLNAFKGSGDNIPKWHSAFIEFTVYNSIDAESQLPDPLPSEFRQIEERVTEAKTIAEIAANTATLKANAVQDLAEQVSNDKTIVLTNTKTASDSAENAKNAAEVANTKANNAAVSESTATQALMDLLAMLGTDIATLVGGKIPLNQIPATATQEIYSISSENELITLTAQKGDLGVIINLVDNVPTITKTYQLLGNGDSTIRDNWIVWGTSYAVQAGNALTANNAENANTINGHRLVTMTQSQYDVAVKDPETVYLVGV